MSKSYCSMRWFRLCSSQTVMILAVSIALGAGLTTSAPALQRRAGHDTSSAAPRPDLDERFVRMGQTYLAELGRAYATAWKDGAEALESGQLVAVALERVGQSWECGRVQLFDSLIAPELSKILAEGKLESQVTTANRQALAKAWRGLASGLASPRRRP